LKTCQGNINPRGGWLVSQHLVVASSIHHPRSSRFGSMTICIDREVRQNCGVQRGYNHRATTCVVIGTVKIVAPLAAAWTGRGTRRRGEQRVACMLVSNPAPQELERIAFLRTSSLFDASLAPSRTDDSFLHQRISCSVKFACLPPDRQRSRS
jgi:hypothetical protein